MLNAAPAAALPAGLLDDVDLLVVNEGELATLAGPGSLAEQLARLAVHCVVVTLGARDIGALTALSPLGVLDGLIVPWRTLSMLRAIAELYGARPGAAASIGRFSPTESGSPSRKSRICESSRGRPVTLSSLAL